MTLRRISDDDVMTALDWVGELKETDENDKKKNFFFV